MKEARKNQIKRIAYNCRRATFLIEKKLIDRITLRERMELKIHLLGCSVCRVFEKQSIAINHMVRELFHGPKQHNLVMDEHDKQKMQELIEKELNKH